MRTVLVCGGRTYGVRRDTARADVQRLLAFLDEVHARGTISLLGHGGSSGADAIAGDWAATRGVDIVIYPANWRGHGPSAGARRNQRMLEHLKPDVVVAAPGWRGTADMVRRAKAAGVPVLEVAQGLPETQLTVGENDPPGFLRDPLKAPCSECGAEIGRHRVQPGTQWLGCPAGRPVEAP